MANYTSQIITQQLAQRSGQVARSASNGVTKFVNELDGSQLGGPSAGSVILANPQKPNDPKLTASALDAARGCYAGKNVPESFVEAIASVAAYTTATTGVPIGNLLSSSTVSLKLIEAYNFFKPKGSQVGILSSELSPSWVNNPTLRGSIDAAITDQP